MYVLIALILKIYIYYRKKHLMLEYLKKKLKDKIKNEISPLNCITNVSFKFQPIEYKALSIWIL